MSEPVDLDGIEARANAATPGPWECGHDWGAVTRGSDSVIHAWYRGECPCCGESIKDLATVQVEPSDTEFIAHAREDAPALVAEVRALRATNARLNRRAQVAEAAINELTSTTGRGKSRPVAAEVWERCQRSHENVFHRAERAEAALRDVVGALGPDRICECPPSDGECGLREEAADALATARAALTEHGAAR